jgi:actin-related protein
MYKWIIPQLICREILGTDMEGKTPVVIDNGAGWMKVGFAGESKPRSIFRNIVGYPNYSPEPGPSHYFGNNALKMEGRVRLREPISRCEIEDWHAMEKIWDFTFYSALHIDPATHPVLIAVTQYEDYQKIAEIMFESFHVPALCILQDVILSFLTANRPTACIVDIGEKFSYIAPIYENAVDYYSISGCYFCGHMVTRYLDQLLRQRGIWNSSTTNCRRQYGWEEIIREIKEKCCYVAPDEDYEFKHYKEKDWPAMNYQLPDGTSISLDKERFLGPEAFFHPERVGVDMLLPKEIVRVIQRCENDANEKGEAGLKRALLQNILFTGGSARIPGFKERLRKEIQALVKNNFEINVDILPDYELSSWVGGSKYAARGVSAPRWITRKEYNETGPEIARRPIPTKGNQTYQRRDNLNDLIHP